MNAMLRVVDPGKVEFELKATMTLEEWLEIRDALVLAAPAEWLGPIGTLRSAIQDMTLKAKLAFHPEEKVET